MNNSLRIFALFALLALALAQQHQEIRMQHRKRTPLEEKMLLEYINRTPLLAKVNTLLSKIFPSQITPNIYAYPEVKIINYLDAQYYG